MATPLKNDEVAIYADSLSGSPTISDEGLKKREVQENALWRWNLAMGILHLFQGLLALGLGLGSVGRFKNFQLPFTTLFLAWQQGSGPKQILQVASTVRFCALTSGFALMSAAAHFIVLFFFRSVYIPDLRRGLNKFRWFEYAASSSLMILLVAMLFGMYDILSLVLLMSTNACMNFFGYLMEVLHQYTAPKVDWTPFWFGCFAGVVPWACILAYMCGSPTASTTPAFVYAIYFVTLFAFNTFPVNMALQYNKKGWYSDEYWGFQGGGYLFGEKVYQVQSLVSKTLLLWLVVGGVNQPSNYNS